MQDTTVKESTAEDLWVLAKVKDSVCAINGSCVEAILMLEEEITSLPDSDDVHVGIINLRGGIVPIVDLRRLMGMQSYSQEQDEFENMLEQRKQDHVRWVDELRRCLTENDQFTLAVDPHKCAFGRWYDSYKPRNQSVAFHLRKIDEPHRRLHATATEAFACTRQCDACKRQECLKTSLNRASNEYMPRVLSLLEEAKQVFRSSHRKMAVVLAQGGLHRGILVDEVLSAESFASVAESSRLGETLEQPLVTHIAQRKGGQGQVLVLSEDRLLTS